MGNLDSTLGEIQRLEKSAGAENDPPAFSKEAIAKFAEASKVYRAALEEVEKNQPAVIKGTTHGEAIATARAAMLNLEGTMSLIWEENGLNDTIRGQFKNVIGLLEPMTRAATEKTATDPAPADDPKPDETPAASDDPKPDEATPTAKGAAADNADDKNTPEGHSEGNGGDPQNPDNVIWPKDLNTEDFRKNETKEKKPSWGEDPKPKAAV